MISIDLLSVGIGLGSFGVFLILQVIFFRWIKPEALLKSLLLLVIGVSVLPISLMLICWKGKLSFAAPTTWMMGMMMASLLSFLLSFVYILCIFGPYETSVRMRLVCEIASCGKSGITRQELFKRYNSQVMAQLRLRRLIGSGDIIEKDGRYILIKKQNVFFLFDAIAGLLKKWINA